MDMQSINLQPQLHATGQGHTSDGSIENAEVARILRHMADVLEIESANPFRIRAYRNAARLIEEFPQRIDALARSDPHRLTELPGIGKDLAGKICEICKTGALSALKQVENKAPRGAIELMQLPGLGPKRTRILCERLHVHSLGQLQRAAQGGRIHRLKGFGERMEQRILHELLLRTNEQPRMLRAVADQYAQSLVNYLRALPKVQRVEVAGSYRRCRETVGDLDILITCPPDVAVAKHFVAYPQVKEVLAMGSTKASIRLQCGLQVDLRVVPPQSYGAALYYFTGSKAHNIAIRRLGQQRALKINEYGVFKGKRRIAGAEEAEIFAAVGLPLIPPELREDRGEIEAARQGKMPHLIEQRDICGDLHAHTTDSDGRDALAEMAHAAEAIGYEYLAITDHGPALRMVQGLDAAGFRRQMARIDRLNDRLHKMTVLKGAEVDIHPDGSLDLDDALLEELDIVLVSIHSKFDLPGEAQTLRIIRALQHPAVDVLAHPTGRLIGKRRGMLIDVDQIYRAAADHGVILEINAQPERLDLDDVSARAAAARGLFLEISTDAHSAHELSFMRWGIDQARRGWIEKSHVANTRPLKELMKLLHRGRR